MSALRAPLLIEDVRPRAPLVEEAPAPGPARQALPDHLRRIFAGERCPKCSAFKLIERPHVDGHAFCYGCGHFEAVLLQALSVIRAERDRFQKLRRRAEEAAQ